MKILRQTTTLLFLIAGLSGLYSQNSFKPGKIITNNNDTIAGLIDTSSDSKLYKECQFKKQENSQVLIYTPVSLRAFIIGNDKRKFVRTSNPSISGEVFFEVLCEGSINLYYSVNKVALFFIQKKDETTAHYLPYNRTERYVDNGYTKRLKIIETTNHLDTLKMLMNDKPFLYSEIDKIQRPDKKNLIEIVSKYNLNSSIFQPQNDRKTIVSSTQPELLRTGKMNLYVVTDSVAEQHFYIQKGSGTKLIELPYKKMKDINYHGLLIHSYSNHTTNHMDTLKKYMFDALPLYPSIEEIRITAKNNLQKLIDEYNSYTDEKTYVQKHTLKRLPLNIDIVPGLNFLFSSLDNPTVRFGSLIDIGFIHSNKHFYLKSGLFVYKSFTPLTDRYYDPASAEYEYHYYPPNTTFKIPLQIEYRFSEKPIQPLLSVGYNLYLFNEIKPDNKTLYPVISPGLNIQMGSRYSVRLNIELEFKNETLVSYIPETFKRAGLYFGLQIKL
ncbi:MAG: hypothetical protein WC542_02275 [Paludibacter sp.]